MSAQARKYLIWGAAVLVLLIAIALIRGKTTVNVVPPLGS